MFHHNSHRSHDRYLISQWIAVKVLYHTLNTDGSVQGNKGGIGALLRKWDGNIVGGLNEPLQDTTSHLVEGLALFRGLQLAIKYNYIISCCANGLLCDNQLTEEAAESTTLTDNEHYYCMQGLIEDLLKGEDNEDLQGRIQSRGLVSNTNNSRDILPPFPDFPFYLINKKL